MGLKPVRMSKNDPLRNIKNAPVPFTVTDGVGIKPHSGGDRHA